MPTVDATDRAQNSQWNVNITGYSAGDQSTFSQAYTQSNTSISTDPSVSSYEDGDMTHYIESQEEDFTDIDLKFRDGIDESDANRIYTSMSRGIFGMPYQFSKEIDTVVDGTDYGRKFMDKIASVMPVMFICPGEPLFMPGYSDDEKKGILNLTGNDDNSVTVDDVLNEPGAPYYVFNSKFNNYAKYVNLQVRALANFMGLGSKKYAEGFGKNYLSFELNDVLNSDFKSLFNASTSVAFYLDADASVSENFSNSTTESMLTQKVNSISDISREVQFLVGNTTGIAGAAANALGGTADVVSQLGDSVMGLSGLGNGILGKLNVGVNTVLAGGKMSFPEIWSSSDYSRSYSITIKLRSPDPDPLSIMQNIYVPLCCLTSLAMPVQIGNNANGYLSPFLVRATYKSIFNCDLGIVSSLEINKGGEDKWNSMGMPTSVDVTLTIKDLYSTMFMSRTPKGLSCNMAQMDYLALMAGLDMNKDWAQRNTKLRVFLEFGKILATPSKPWEYFKSGANKTVAKFLNKTLRADVRWNS